MLPSDPYAINAHKFLVTFFPDRFAAISNTAELSLPELAELIGDTEGADKAGLPWLKLAAFGEQKTDKGSLRSNANMRELTGIEAEHDAGTMTYAAAYEALQQAGIRALIYTTPSYIPDVKERWRVLAPLSNAMPTTERAALVARLNGVLGGALAAESFTLSQAYLFGHAGDGAYGVDVIEGDFIDLCDDLAEGAIGKARVGPKAGRVTREAIDGEAIGYSDDDVEALLDKSQVKGHWHNSMVSATASLAGRGLSLAEICERCARAATGGASDPELTALAKSAVDKFGVGLPREVEHKLTEGLKALQAEIREAPTEAVMFDSIGVSPGMVTQDGVARVFAERYADQMQYCHHAGAWLEWTGAQWKRDDVQRAFQFSRELGREFSEHSARTEFKALRTAAFASGVEKLARVDPRIAATSERWDQDPFLLGTPEGAVDLRTGRLKASDPADGITRLAAVAPRAGMACLVWQRFLSETFAGDAELIRFIQQWFGYCLTGDTSEHALLFGFGNGGNGKSVLMNTISGIMGGYVTSAPMGTFTAAKHDAHPTEIAMLRGARLVAASETERGRAWAESRIKQLTGGDPVTARFMHKDFFTFQPAFKLAIMGNHKPSLRSIDDAVRRRFNLVPFMNRPAVVDHRLEQRLKPEWPGILQWMVEGCLDWQANGLIRPAAVALATDSYFEDQDLFGQWLKEACEEQPRHTEPTAALFSKWEVFAHEAGDFAGSRKLFAEELSKRGFSTVKAGHGNVRSVKGLKLKQSQLIKSLLTVVPKDPE